MGDFNHSRRETVTVRVGKVNIGGSHPVVLQSMTSTPTMDTDASVAQACRIADAGGQIVRLTAPGSREALNIGRIGEALRAAGRDIPLVADIHFNPRAALAAAGCCEKVRINPGNFVDPGRTFVKLDFTDEEYAAEITKIDKALAPLIDICRANHTALRIGVNHGSLSDRIMSRYGDTPAGMVESAMEFLRACRRLDFDQVVISIKASNVRVMVETMRRLVAAMDAEQMHFPLHLGVTEAGDGEDARIKSAVGIGTLLAEGTGDTIRVSLSEDPEREIPVARMIADYAAEVLEASAGVSGSLAPGYDRMAPARRTTEAVGVVGGRQVTAVIGTDPAGPFDTDSVPDDFAGRMIVRGEAIEIDAMALTAAEAAGKVAAEGAGRAVIVNADGPSASTRIEAIVHELTTRGLTNPIVARIDYNKAGDITDDELTVRAAIDLGRLLLNGLLDGVAIDFARWSPARVSRLLYSILQSTRLRMTRTEYIACPGCGRTLYDLQTTLRRIKEATVSLRGLKIGVMGCIVNGPGEMADADYGYVGAGPGRVSLYKGKQCVVKNIPTDEAVDRLIALIKEEGDWR